MSGVEIVRAETIPVSATELGNINHRSSLDYATYKVSPGILGVDPDFSLPESGSSDWALSYILFGTNAWRLQLSDFFRALQGLEVMLTMDYADLSRSALKDLFKWILDASEAFCDALDFSSFVLEPVILDRAFATASATGSAQVRAETSESFNENDRVSDLFVTLCEEREALASKLTHIQSMRKSLGLVREERLVPELMKRSVVFIVHALGHAAREEEVYAPLLRECFGSWELQQLIDAKRIFYNKLTSSNAYLRMVARGTHWQNRDEASRSMQLYVSGLRQRVMYSVAVAQVDAKRELLRKLFEASFRPRRGGRFDDVLSRAGSSVTTDRSGSTGILRGMSNGAHGTRRRSLDAEFDEIRQVQGETRTRASLDTGTANLPYSASRIRTERSELEHSRLQQERAQQQQVTVVVGTPHKERVVAPKPPTVPSKQQSHEVRFDVAALMRQSPVSTPEDSQVDIAAPQVLDDPPEAKYDSDRDLPSIEFEDIEDDGFSGTPSGTSYLPFSTRMSDAIA
ncbi:hypothetical protein FVE85_9193 [Porphyridium purpureum]|uniref:Uncharacterized protein n=1 Tax=Porphyridium purpureum TaxID=35688 RepID=A0A5J4YN42_PORPP|nr:hypothetical protein FVE85_9193 [Porphyridium purpureum]|eukprot:POR3964..scf222_8